MAHLSVALAVEVRGIRVTWRLDDVALDDGDVLAQLPLSIAGAPTLDLDDEAVAATDEGGRLPLVMRAGQDEDGDPLHQWSVGRSSSGPVSVSYLAEPVAAEPRAATPPLELRAEGGGLSGALKCFLLLPPGPEGLTFDVRWIAPPLVGRAKSRPGSWTAVSSLGEGGG